MASPKIDTTVHDAKLAAIAAATRVDACTTEPTSRTEAITTYTVGNYTLTAGDGNGDWTIANGDTSGRKLTLGAQSGNNGTGTGAANFLAYTDASTLLLVTDGSGDTVNSGSPWTLASYDPFEDRSPVDE